MKSDKRSTEDWKLERYNYITGTDIGKILGVDNNCTACKLLELKAFKKEPKFNDYANKIMDLGTEYESIALSHCLNALEFIYEKDFSNKKIIPNLMFSDKLNYLAGTPDCILPGLGVIEIKTHWYPSEELAQPYVNISDVKLKHWLQLQTYLFITDHEDGFLFSWTLQNGYHCFLVKNEFKKIIKYHGHELETFYKFMKKAQKDTGLVPGYKKLLRLKRDENFFYKLKKLNKLKEISTSLLF